MTREAWDAEFDACMARLRSKGADLAEAQRLARDITTVRFGARPAGLPLRLRLGLAVAVRFMEGLNDVEVSPMWQRVIVAITYGIGAASPVLAAAFSDSVVTGQEWSGIGMAFFIAFWGTFKSNTTIVSPNRTVWTPKERKVETAKMDAGLLVLAAKTVADAKVEDAKVFADAKVEAEKILTR